MAVKGPFAALYLRSRRVRPAGAPYSRKEVFARWDGRCAYCNAAAEHLDHIRPVSRGGRDVLRNVIPACAACNVSKSDMSLAAWAATF